MEGCVTRAVHDLITACARDDSAKLHEAVSMVTVATESLTTEKGEISFYCLSCDQ